MGGRTPAEDIVLSVCALALLYLTLIAVLRDIVQSALIMLLYP